MQSCVDERRLLAEKLVQVLNEAHDDDDGRTNQSDKKEIYQQMHSIGDKYSHMDILTRFEGGAADRETA